MREVGGAPRRLADLQAVQLRLEDGDALLEPSEDLLHREAIIKVSGQ